MYKKIYIYITIYIYYIIEYNIYIYIYINIYMAVSHLLLCMICAPLIFGLSGLAFPHFGGKDPSGIVVDIANSKANRK